MINIKSFSFTTVDILLYGKLWFNGDRLGLGLLYSKSSLFQLKNCLINGITLNLNGDIVLNLYSKLWCKGILSPLLMKPVGGYRCPRHLLVSLFFCLPVRPPFVRLSVCLSVSPLGFSYSSQTFFVILTWKFGIWICLDIIQIMWLLSRVTFLHELLPNETLAKAKVSFSGQFWSSFEILTSVMNWSWRNTGQGQFLSRLTYF